MRNTVCIMNLLVFAGLLLLLLLRAAPGMLGRPQVDRRPDLCFAATRRKSVPLWRVARRSRNSSKTPHTLIREVHGQQSLRHQPMVLREGCIYRCTHISYVSVVMAPVSHTAVLTLHGSSAI